MDDERGRVLDASGFEFTRRRFLRSTAAVGASAAVAGCTDDGSDADQGPLDPIEDLVDDGLRVVESELVQDSGGWMDFREGDQTGSLEDDYGQHAYVRVVVRNEGQDPVGAVGVTTELFDDDLEFRGTRGATIPSLRPQEEFEGYMPYVDGALPQDGKQAAGYLVRVDASGRPGPDAVIGEDPPDDLDVGDQGRTVDDITGPDSPIDDVVGIGFADRPADAVSVADDCVVDERVEGTIETPPDEAVRRMQVLVRFVDDDGRVLGTSTDTVLGIEAGGQADFEVTLDDAGVPSARNVADYEIAVGEFAPLGSAVR